MEKIRVGPGTSELIQMGPLISQEQLEKVDSYVQLGQEEGATLVLGGMRSIREEHDPKGFFYEPTLLTNCKASMSVVQVEIFGPVITVEKFSSDEEVLGLANDTEYGLSAGFWTKSTERIKSRIPKYDLGFKYIFVPSLVVPQFFVAFSHPVIRLEGRSANSFLLTFTKQFYGPSYDRPYS